MRIFHGHLQVVTQLATPKSKKEIIANPADAQNMSAARPTVKMAPTRNKKANAPHSADTAKMIRTAMTSIMITAPSEPAY